MLNVSITKELSFDFIHFFRFIYFTRSEDIYSKQTKKFQFKLRSFFFVLRDEIRSLLLETIYREKDLKIERL